MIRKSGHPKRSCTNNKQNCRIFAGLGLIYAARMATTELTAETTGSGNRAGIYLAFLLVFTLG